jgi:hypothetical protein
VALHPFSEVLVGGDDPYMKSYEDGGCLFGYAYLLEDLEGEKCDGLSEQLLHFDDCGRKDKRRGKILVFSRG